MTCTQQIIRRHLTAVGATLAACCLALPLHAQDLADLPLEDLLRVEVSTASRFTQDAREAASQVQLITAEDIARHGWRTLGEALASLPGFYLSDDRAYQYLGARGFLIPGDYSTRFLLLLDGQRLNDNVFEQAQFGFSLPVDLSLVERIEVIPGPGSALYGANALFGVINVITRQSVASDSRRVAATVTSDGWRELNATVRRRFGEDGPTLTASLGAGVKGARDLTVPGAGNGSPSSEVARGLDRSELARGYLSLSQSGVSLAAWFGQREVHPPSALYGSLFGDRRLQLRDHQHGVSVSLERDVGRDLQFSGRLAVQGLSYRGIYPFDDLAGSSYLNRDDMRGEWWSADSRFLYTGLAGHKLVYGLDLQQDLQARLRNADLPAGSTPAFSAEQKSWRAGAYLQDEWLLARDWRLSTGLRYDYYGIGLDRVSPRLGLVWAASPTTTIKLVAGEAFRLPSAYERLYAAGSYLPNLSLRPEQIRTTELIAEQAVGTDQLVGVSLYQYRVQRLIEQVGVNNDTEVQFRNAAGTVRSSGVELSWKAARLGAGSMVASLALNQTTDESGARLANSPRWMAKLRATHPLPDPRWQLAAELDAIGPRAIDAASGSQSISAQWWVNATLMAKDLLPGVQARLRILNLFDRDLLMPVGEAASPLLPFYGRTFQLMLSHEF